VVKWFIQKYLTELCKLPDDQEGSWFWRFHRTEFMTLGLTSGPMNYPFAITISLLNCSESLFGPDFGHRAESKTFVDRGDVLFGFFWRGCHRKEINIWVCVCNRVSQKLSLRNQRDMKVLEVSHAKFCMKKFTIDSIKKLDFSTRKFEADWKSDLLCDSFTIFICTNYDWKTSHDNLWDFCSYPLLSFRSHPECPDYELLSGELEFFSP
jgi:hypothetical protein